MKEKRTCLVVGNGAIGTAVASRLSILGFDTAFLGRKGPVAIKCRFQGWGKTTYLDILALSQADLSDVKIAFVTVKSYDLSGALDRYLPYLPRGIAIIPLGNGAIENLVSAKAKKFPHFFWRIGSCNFGVSQLSDGIFALKSHAGRVTWGAYENSQNDKQKPTAMEEQILRCDAKEFFFWSPRVLLIVRKKWLLNTVINTICGAFEFKENGTLLNEMHQLEAVFTEAFNLGKEMWGPWPDSFDSNFSDLISLISATSKNENSMARDVRLGRRTENEYLAKLASKKRGYPSLQLLSERIESKPSQTRRRRKSL